MTADAKSIKNLTEIRVTSENALIKENEIYLESQGFNSLFVKDCINEYLFSFFFKSKVNH